MNLMPTILTSSRPSPTLSRTIASMKRAGWEFPHVFDGTPLDGKTCAKGCTAGNIGLMEIARWIRDGADGLLVVEDDVVFCRGAREYLDQSPWPEDPTKIAVVSPYCNEAYSKQPATNGRWHLENRGLYLAGSQAWIYPFCNLPGIIEYLKQSEWGVDRAVGEYAALHGLSVWYHTPSLADHIGRGGNSAVGYNDDCGEIYRTCDFPGEDFDARSLL